MRGRISISGPRASSAARATCWRSRRNLRRRSPGRSTCDSPRASSSRLTAAPSVNPEAHDAYLKGRYFFNRPSDENLQKAIAQFEEAVRLSPDVCAGVFGTIGRVPLGRVQRRAFSPPPKRGPRPRRQPRKPSRLDDNSAEAHTSLAVFKLFYEYDMAGCEREFRRAFRAQPELRVRARSVRHGAGLPGTVRRSDRRGQARDRTGSAVSTGPHRCDRPVHVPTERGGGQESSHGGQRSSIRCTSSPS